MENLKHPNFNGATFKEVTIAKRMLVEQIFDSEQLKQYIANIEYHSKNKQPFLLFSTNRAIPILLNDISAYAIIRHKVDWSDLEAGISDRADNRKVQLHIKRTTDKNSISVKLLN